jgi:hypothetical protein
MQLQTYSPPNPQQIHALLDILLSNFISNLTRIEEKNKYKNKSGQIVYIHHLSDTYLSNNLFLGCTEFYGNEQGRTYMRYPFPVSNY